MIYGKLVTSSEISGTFHGVQTGFEPSKDLLNLVNVLMNLTRFAVG